jgi:hypothetical protein
VKRVIDRCLKDYIWRHRIEDEMFILINTETGQEFPVPRSKRFSLERAIISANQRERLKRKIKK